MPRISNVQRRARDQILHLAASGLSPERLASRLMAALQIAVPGDGYRLFGLDPATHLVNRLLAASEEDAWARLEWLRDVYLTDTPLLYIDHGLLLRENLPAVAVHDRQEMSLGLPPDLLGRISAREHYRTFHELNSPIGGCLVAHFNADGQWVAALQLYRRDPRHHFREEDVTFVRRLAPDIGRALAASLARERASATTTAALDATGVFILDADRQVRYSTPAGETWLRQLRDAERTGETPLPTAVWSAVAGLRGTGGTGARALTVPTATGPVRVEASMGGPDGSVAVVLAPVLPPEPPGIPKSWELTRQERRVVELLVLGLGNREIAQSLSISENTVEFHLRHAYDKLDVRSRNQLIARFFRETYWLGLRDAGQRDAPGG